MEVFFDTNVVLDVLLARRPWFDDGAALWKACDSQKINGYISATTLTDIFYIARQQTDRTNAFHAIRICLHTFTSCTVNADIILYALNLPGIDFEDNIQIACAVRYRCECIVTRDIKEFVQSSIDALTPRELLRKF